MVASFAARVEEENLVVSSTDQISSWTKTMLQCSVLKIRQVELRTLLHSTTRGHQRCFGVTNTLIVTLAPVNRLLLTAVINLFDVKTAGLSFKM